MSRDDHERELHDYLDGRLSAPEHRAFEKRLKVDPELARKLASHDEVRRALREATVDLPPGFHARARARFEERRRTPFPLHRRLSWEIVGLGVAALLVIAILLPKAWEDRRADRPTILPSAPEKSESLAARPEPPSSEYESSREALRRLQKKAAPEEETGAVADAVEPPGNEAPDLAAQAPAAEPAPRPGEKVSAARAKDDDGADAQVLESLGYVGDAKTESDRVPETAPGRRAGEIESSKKMAETSGARERDFAPVPNEAEAPSENPWRGMALPEGIFEPPAERVSERFEQAPADAAPQRAASPVAPSSTEAAREVIVIDDPETWDRVRGDVLDEGTHSVGVFSHAEPDFSLTRLVLIAPRPEPIDCKALRWLREGQEIVIELAPAPVSVPSPTGCGLWIPAGNEPVTFRGERHP